MGKFFLALIMVSVTLTVGNVWIIKNYYDSPYTLMIVYICNLSVIVFSSIFIKVFDVSKTSLKNAMTAVFQMKHSKNKSVNSAELEMKIELQSVAIFIRILTYTLPILLFTGLYFISTTGKLEIESANSWVSFILGIAAFVLSLISLWQSQNYNKQSETTFNRIFDLLNKISTETTLLKKDQEHLINSYTLTRKREEIRFSDKVVNASFLQDEEQSVNSMLKSDMGVMKSGENEHDKE